MPKSNPNSAACVNTSGLSQLLRAECVYNWKRLKIIVNGFIVGKKSDRAQMFFWVFGQFKALS